MTRRGTCPINVLKEEYANIQSLTIWHDKKHIWLIQSQDKKFFDGYSYRFTEVLIIFSLAVILSIIFVWYEISSKKKIKESYEIS